MATEANQPANENAKGSRLTMVPVAGELRAVRTLETVDEESGGSESAREAEQPAAAKGELKDSDYADKTEGSDNSEDELEEDSAASEEKKEADSVTPNPVIYFYDNDEMDGEPIGCSFENMDVREMGREHYALVGPTALTGGTLVCAMVALLPGHPDIYGVEDTWVLKRTSVCRMSRGKDMHFAYATMDSEEYVDDSGVSKLTT
jgi:hypothetical protein